jgi:hypothetical protein
MAGAGAWADSWAAGPAADEAAMANKTTEEANSNGFIMAISSVAVPDTGTYN